MPMKKSGPSNHLLRKCVWPVMRSRNAFIAAKSQPIKRDVLGTYWEVSTWSFWRKNRIPLNNYIQCRPVVSLWSEWAGLFHFSNVKRWTNDTRRYKRPHIGGYGFSGTRQSDGATEEKWSSLCRLLPVPCGKDALVLCVSANRHIQMLWLRWRRWCHCVSDEAWWTFLCGSGQAVGQAVWHRSGGTGGRSRNQAETHAQGGAVGGERTGGEVLCGAVCVI